MELKTLTDDSKCCDRCGAPQNKCSHAIYEDYSLQSLERYRRDRHLLTMIYVGVLCLVIGFVLGRALAWVLS